MAKRMEEVFVRRGIEGVGRESSRENVKIIRGKEAPP